jgi:GNAT superfamily N-acetyltransferase
MKIERIGPDRLEDLLPLVREYHALDGMDMREATRRAAMEGLLADSSLGTAWAIVEDGSWVGYIALTYGYSIEFAGRDAFVDEMYIREDYRGRGFGREALERMKAHARETGIAALHLEVDPDNGPAHALYEKLGFELRDRYVLMSVKL